MIILLVNFPTIMFLRLTVNFGNFRRILAIGLISLTLFLGSGVRSDRAWAEVSQPEPVGISEQGTLNDSEYESAKANRRELQAELSKQAAKVNSDSDSVAEKLNLDEIVAQPVKDSVNK